MNSLLQKINSHPLARYLKYALLLLAVFVIYKIYLWSITETTDNAYVEADISYVSAEISGSVKSVISADNVPVQKDDIIAEIDDQGYKASLAKAEANAAAALQAIKITEQNILLEQITYEKNKAALELAKINFDVASTDYKRTVDLSNDNFTSKKLLDNARVAFEKGRSEYIQSQLSIQASEHNLQSLQARKSMEEASLQAREQEKILAAKDLENTKLKAPIDGVVANNSLKIGNFVRPGSMIFAVVPQSRLYIKANFKETQVKKFKSGMKVKIKFDAASRLEIYGTIRNISPATGSRFSLIPPDNATGNFTKVVQRVSVLIDFDLPTTPKDKNHINIVPGMSAIVAVKT